MEEILKKLLESEVLADDTKEAIKAEFVKIAESLKKDIEENVRAEYAKRYKADKTKIAETVGKFVEARTKAEIEEFKESMKALDEQRLKYVNAMASLKESARAEIKKRLSLFAKVFETHYKREMQELHEELKTNRKTVLATITESKARGEADRKAFRSKAAKVLEHIIKVKFGKEMAELRDDIKRASENDFGRRIVEAFMPEAQKLFFNASKSHRQLLDQMESMKKTHAAQTKKLHEALKESQEKAVKATRVAVAIKESAERQTKMSKLVASVPAGEARAKMKTLLEATSTKDLDKTFKKYAGQILNESRASKPEKKALTEVSVRTGNLKETTIQQDDDEEFVRLRARAGLLG